MQDEAARVSTSVCTDAGTARGVEEEQTAVLKRLQLPTVEVPVKCCLLERVTPCMRPPRALANGASRATTAGALGQDGLILQGLLSSPQDGRHATAATAAKDRQPSVVALLLVGDSLRDGRRHSARVSRVGDGEGGGRCMGIARVRGVDWMMMWGPSWLERAASGDARTEMR